MFERVDLSPDVVLYRGDCLEVMPTLEENSIDSIVTDPPYGLNFMGKDWDHGIPGEHFWREALRVAKPGAHLLAFGGTRTFHRLAVAIEDAGWEIRDTIMWVYAQGFPKSHDVSKAIDKEAGAEREVIAPNQYAGRRIEGSGPQNGDACYGQYGIPGNITAPATDAAREWEGWGTALKPSWEPIIVARKPLEKDLTVAENVLKWGTGAINVDACRVGTERTITQAKKGMYGAGSTEKMREQGFRPYDIDNRDQPEKINPQGRWPSNLIHDGSDEVLEGFPNTGSAARFFYCAKASKRDRDEGCEGLTKRKSGAMEARNRESGKGQFEGPTPIGKNHHPTVKPTALMRYICKLVTPPGGVILDMFMGSGSTGKAAILEGFKFIGIELDAELGYFDISVKRIEQALLQPRLEMPEAKQEPKQEELL